MLIKNWIAVRKQSFSKSAPNEDTLESDMLIDEMFIINEMVRSIDILEIHKIIQILSFLSGILSVGSNRRS